jgi:hypothetical protein
MNFVVSLPHAVRPTVDEAPVMTIKLNSFPILMPVGVYIHSCVVHAPGARWNVCLRVMSG